MSALSRLQKLEVVAASEVPCACHALAAVTPTPPGAEVWEGGCLECSEAILYHTTAPAGRERELHAELYGPGATLATLTASRRSLAAFVWLSRRGCADPTPADSYRRALIEEQGRRMAEKWEAHWRTVSDEVLEAAVELLEGQQSDAELKEIIWPGRDCA